MGNFTNDFVEGFGHTFPGAIESGGETFHKTRSFRLMQAQFDHQKLLDEQELEIKKAEEARVQAEYDRQNIILSERENALNRILKSQNETGAGITKRVKQGQKMNLPYQKLAQDIQNKKDLITLDPDSYIKANLPPPQLTLKEQSEINENVAQADYAKEGAALRKRTPKLGGGSNSEIRTDVSYDELKPTERTSIAGHWEDAKFNWQINNPNEPFTYKNPRDYYEKVIRDSGGNNREFINAQIADLRGENYTLEQIEEERDILSRAGYNVDAILENWNAE